MACLIQGVAELTKILGWDVHIGDGTARFIPYMLYGAVVWRSCRRLHLGYVALLKEIKDYPSTVRCGVIVLVAVVIPEMVAWQMALRCFAKCPSRAHRWCMSRRALEAIWHHCEKLPRRVPNHNELGHYKPHTFPGSAHQVNHVH